MRTKRLIVAAVVGSVYAAALIGLGREVFFRPFLPDASIPIWLVGSSLVAGTSLAAVIALAKRGSWRSILSGFFWCVVGFVVAPSNVSLRAYSVPEAFISYGLISVPILWGLSVLARLHLRGGPMTTEVSQTASGNTEATVPQSPAH